VSSNKITLRQSAVLPFRQTKGKTEILLITSLDTGRWVLPKGKIEPGFSARRSAEKEAYEEAGIRGRVERKSIDSYIYEKSLKKGGVRCRVEVFPMKVRKELTNWPEKKERTRAWFSPNEAAQRVNEKKLKKILTQFGKSV